MKFSENPEDEIYSTPYPGRSMDSVIWKIVAFSSLLIGLVGVILAVIAFDKANQLPVYPKSCQEVSGSSGLYAIQPNSNIQPFQVYCDMSTSSGGWTLVASVHENNIDGKCTVGDKWSSEQGREPRSAIIGSGNWQNKRVFGNIEGVTEDDYKNPAYYAVNAANVMIWHVPNDVGLSEIQRSAFLKYHTYNSFLVPYGGTLQNMYSKSLPLESVAGGLDSLLTKINEQSSSITSQIPGWFSYTYDSTTPNTRIIDGGDDMYDSGNMVAYRIQNQNFTLIHYDAPYFLYVDGVEVKSSASYPFITLAWIGSGLGGVETSDVQYFDYRVSSNFGADGNGNFATYSNTRIIDGLMTGMYRAYNVFNAGDPSICEVYFYIGSAAMWQSRFPTMNTVSWIPSTRSATNVVRFNDGPKNVLLGYTLLSKRNGVQVTQQEVEAVIRSYMRVAVNFTFSATVPHVAAPVRYIVGNNQTVMDGIPQNLRATAKPGFIQFRAFNSVGLSNALCPGVRVDRSNSPEHVCIGGTNTARRDLSQCGDFAGWAGRGGNRGSENSPSATGKSLRDIDSTILIFTR